MLAEKFRAAMVVARRDFVAVIFSKTFIFFLVGPLFPILVGGLAGGIGRAAHDMDQPEIGIAMSATDAQAMVAARAAMAGHMAGPIPEFQVVSDAAEDAQARAALVSGDKRLAAVVSGTLSAPRLTGTEGRVDEWRGIVSAIAARARSGSPEAYPAVDTEIVRTSAAQTRSSQLTTAQAGQTLLFLLVMLLAGMVLSNLVEEKANKIIEVLAAAIPMDALFLGKLFAMLGVSLVGVAVWGSIGSALALMSGKSLAMLAVPAVGWPAFFVLGFLYFAMAYLLLGSLFLAIGGMATTVRDVQTLSMPVTMLQLLVFLFASYALAKPGSVFEWAAIVFPFSSPFAMLARAAMDGGIAQHFVALAWQGMWVMLIVNAGARLFRRTVMKSGPARGKAKKRKVAAA
ncbi:MAG: ABC transporter permease [Sphingomonadales bacterium]|nr:ABC transporter permease [Sphingomonadales bacterium]MDE2567808.1 ABC transporter permease [Sphingomonadales bacterium]